VSARSGPASALLRRAVELHRGNQFAQARDLYETILGAEPRQFDALHLSGVLALQMGKPTLALERIEAALAERAAEPAVLYNRAAVHEARADWAAALGDYEAALALKPDYLDAEMNRGTLLQRLGRFEEALASFDRVIEQNDLFTSAHFNRGNLLRDMGLWEDALASYDRAIALDSQHVDSHLNRGIVLRKLERCDDSLASTERAISLQPNSATAHHNRASILSQLERWNEAEAAFLRALALEPTLAEAQVGLGLVLKQRGELESALQCLDQALTSSDPRPEWYFHRGTIQSELGRIKDALSSYELAISLAPGYAQAHANRGNMLSHLQQFEASVLAFDRALALNPGLAAAHGNRGNALSRLQRIDEALISFDRAIALDPDCAEFHVDRSMALLVKGDLTAGWKDYEWRSGYVLTQAIAATGRPRWRGEESISGDTILVHAEQGLGDTLQFCRYVPLIAERGAHVVLCVQPPLVDLLQNLPGARHVIPQGSTLPSFDWHCPLLSLPHAFRTTLQDIPAVTPYVHPDAVEVAAWRTRLSAARRPLVGLAWSGNPGHHDDARRSIPLVDFIAALPAGLRYVCLQNDVRDADRPTLAAHPEIQSFGADRSFGDTAALCSSVDLVISVDTSIAHLSGALGQPTWILLSYGPDWRWLMDRSDSPWYPTARLYRQSSPGDWQGVLEDVCRNLSEFVRTYSGCAAAQHTS